METLKSLYVYILKNIFQPHTMLLMVFLGKKFCIFTLQIYAKLYVYMLMRLILLCWLY